MSHADTLRDLVALLHRTHKLIDELADGAAPSEGWWTRREALSQRIGRLIGSPVTGPGTADRAVVALVEHLDGEAEQEMARGDIRSEAIGGPGCDASMVHYFGPSAAPVARMFDSAGHPPNCPAYTAPDTQAAHALTCTGGPDCPVPGHEMYPAEGKSRESATRTTGTGGRAARVAAATRAEIDRQKAAAAEDPHERARRLDRERDQAGRAYRRATQDADAAWRQIGGRP